jgi:putative cell wall-binding protein
MLRRSLIAAGMAGVLVLGTSSMAGATAGAAANRLAGADRYATARAIATNTFTQATVAIIASGVAYPDALSAAYLSGAEQAPVLLTQPDKLTAGITDTLKALNVKGVQIVGGTSAVSGKVATDLQAAGYTVDRLAGINRYETSRKIAELLPKESVGKYGAGSAAIVVTGEAFPDALSAGPMSASQGVPIVLTNTAGLHDQAKAALTDLGIQQVIILGGTSAVSAESEKQITDMGIAVKRVAGVNRQATAAAMAELERADLNYPLTKVELARGDDFADALAGGARGGHVFAPILLTAVSTLGSDARAFISANNATISAVDVLGGTSAVSDAVANDAVAAAQGQ